MKGAIAVSSSRAAIVSSTTILSTRNTGAAIGGSIGAVSGIMGVSIAMTRVRAAKGRALIIAKVKVGVVIGVVTAGI